MTSQLLKTQFVAIVGLLLTFPAGYFILISILKYILGLPALYDASAPMLEVLGINESFGWNINGLIRFGPFLALLINIAAIIRLNLDSHPGSYHLDVRVLRRPFNWWIIGVSAGCLFTLFTYLLCQNCNG